MEESVDNLSQDFSFSFVHDKVNQQLSVPIIYLFGDHKE